MKPLAACVLAALFLIVAPIAVKSQQPPSQCLKGIDFYKALRVQGEVSMFLGGGPRGSNGLLLQNPQTGAWTFLLVGPDGCLAYSVGGNKSDLSPAAKGNPT